MNSSRALRETIEGLKWATEREARGVILLTPEGRIEFATPAARRLVREYFGGWDDAQLPASLCRQLGSGSTTLERRREGRRLTVSRRGCALRLEEARDGLDLTPREEQILDLVALGKTNAEIARTLWIAPTTVRKHLENIYGKLGVRTRTAAAARVLGVARAAVE
jgi:DNA-binding CsgD family transcriptional regulator